MSKAVHLVCRHIRGGCGYGRSENVDDARQEEVLVPPNPRRTERSWRPAKSGPVEFVTFVICHGHALRVTSRLVGVAESRSLAGSFG